MQDLNVVRIMLANWQKPVAAALIGAKPVLAWHGEDHRVGLQAGFRLRPLHRPGTDMEQHCETGTTNAKL